MTRVVRAAPPLWMHLAQAIIQRLPAGRYRMMDWLCRGSVASFWTRLPEHLGGLEFRCDLRDGNARVVCCTGRYEPVESALVLSLLGPGMTFVDVGANWGYFTLLAAGRVGAQGRVLAVEPDPRLFAMLSDNLNRNALLNRNGLATVTPLPVAITDVDGPITLAGYLEEQGNWGLSRMVTSREESPSCFQAEGRSLDELLDTHNVATVDLLKLDIEGAEDFALRGMSTGLASGRYRRVLLEAHPTLLADHGLRVSDVTSRLTRLGYRCWRIDHSPTATRTAAYSMTINPRDYLRPLDHDGVDADGVAPDAANGDTWPHFLFLMPDLELPA